MKKLWKHGGGRYFTSREISKFPRYAQGIKNEINIFFRANKKEFWILSPLGNPTKINLRRVKGILMNCKTHELVPYIGEIRRAK